MSGRLPTWLENWLGVDSPGAGEGTAWRLETAWGWAPWATLLLVVALVAWIVYCYAKETPDASRRSKALLAGLRVAALGTLLLMIAELVVSLERTGLPTVVVLVDQSGSMGTVDGAAQSESPFAKRLATAQLGDPTRLNLAKLLLLEDNARRLRRIDRRYKLAVFAVATSAMPVSGDMATRMAALRELTADAPESAATRLGAAVRQVLAELKGSPPAALVLVTDGITTDGQTLSDAAEVAARKGVPIFTIGVGHDEPARDVELADLLVDDVVFAGDMVSFEATLVASGLAGETATICLREKGKEAVLAETTATLGEDRQPTKIRLPFRPPVPGDFEFTLDVTPLEGEQQLENNAQSRLVSVREEKVRVLLLASTPSYEYRFLKHMLERDSTVDVRVLLQDADPDYAVIDQSALQVFPVRKEDLFGYDVLIFDDVDLRRLTRSTLANLREFVMEKGGGLVWIAGERYAPQQFREIAGIAPLLPFASSTGGLGDGVAVDGFVVRPTDLGQASAAMQLGDRPLETAKIWRDLPPLYWLLEIGETKPAARVLAEHPSRIGLGGRKLPVFVLQYVGAGKVLFHATDETWRWRFRVGDVYFARYWVQSLRRLARSKLLGSERGVELTADRQTYRRGEPARFRVRFFDDRLAPADDDAVRVVVEQAGQKRRPITLRRSSAGRGVFEGTLSGLATGRYHVLLVRPTVEGRAPTADFRVLAPPGEFERLELDVEELQSAADISHGKFYRFADAADFVDDLPEGRQVPIEELPPEVLWNRWWMIGLLVTLLISEWVLRKRYGML